MPPSPTADAARPPAPPGLGPLLGSVRRRLVRQALLRSGARWLSATVASGLCLVGLAALFGPSPLWRPLCGAWLIGVLALLLGLVHAAWQARRSRFSDEAVARYIGERVPDLRSDLLSAVQLCRQVPAPQLAGGLSESSFTSVALIEELCRRTAAAAATLPLAGLVDLRGASRALLAPALALLLLPLLLSPAHLLRGLRILLQAPPDPTTRSSEPLVGDIRLLLTYPRYTGLPQRTIPGSSGEVLALPGTSVRVEARALSPAERAQLVVQTGGGEPLTRPVQIIRGETGEKRASAPTHPLLAASFPVARPGSYYFVIDRGRNDRVRESEGHRIEVERDHPPRIDLFVPAEDLEISGARRVELAYSAEDDLGLGEIDLVFRVGETPERRKRIRSTGPSAAGPGKQAQPALQRTAAAKIEWDLAELDLSPGVRVMYHLEARDLDDVSGPNRGVSRTYSLRIANPREKHEANLAKQEALREQAIALLGDRIEIGHPEPPEADRVERVWDSHRKTEALLLAVGRLQEDLPRDQQAAKDLRPALQEIGRRLGKLTHEEELLLGELRGRRPGGDRRPGRQPHGKELTQSNDRHVAEMERTVLLLDDLLGRQRLEELLAISDEMSAARDRLKKLLTDYKKTRSDAVRKEIEREIRELERRMQELAEKAQSLQGELPDEFLNSEAMGRNDMQGRLDKLRDLLQHGDIDKAQAELERLSQSLDNLIKGMEGDLRGFRRERFTAEDKALSELEDKLADLAHDEQGLKSATEEIKSQASKRAQQLLQNRAQDLARRLQDKVQKLRKQVEDVEMGPLGPWGTDELEKTQKRVEDLGRMLDQGDLDEARAMAQEAEQSIARLIDELRGEERASRWAQRAQLSRSRQRLEQARPMARELADEIGKALPRPDELLQPEQRKALQDLRARQEAVRRRAQELGKDLQRRARETKEAPLLERLGQEVGEGLQKADGHMERAERELKQVQPRGAAVEQGQAAEQLEQLRKQMQQARRPRDEGAGARLDREPVKIPGADEYRAPKEFRQDILDAAKREAPTEYRDQVKRYYEELVK